MKTAHDWKAQTAARKVAADALAAANPHLTPAASCKGGTLGAAAKNIRVELARAFPSVKFSVRSRRFSGGDAIDVEWTDGPTSAQVDDIIKRYSAGSFDGMTDCYDYARNAWTDAFGDAKYIHARRNYSDAAVASGIRTVCGQWGINPAPSVADFRSGKLWGVHPGEYGRDLQSLVHECLSRRTWAIARRAEGSAK